MNRKISVGMAVSIVILAMTVTFSITMLLAMRLFDSTVSSVKEKESILLVCLTASSGLNVYRSRSHSGSGLEVQWITGS